MPYADLHFHLLPGVDDGPADMDASLELARAAVAEGTGTVVVTPHVRSDLGLTDAVEIHARVLELRFRLEAARIPLEIRCGGELGHELARATVADGTGTVVATPHVRPDLGLTDAVEIHARVLELRFRLEAARIPLEIRCGGELGHELVGQLRQSELELLAQGPSGARWVLVETPFHGIGHDFHEATAELRERGFGVLVAHPERSADASLDAAAGLRAELAAGSLAQLNALSLTGDHGEDACTAAWKLIAEGLIDVVASDAHGPTRPPAMSLARRTLREVGISRRVTAALIGSTPHRLLAVGMPSRRAVAA